MTETFTETYCERCGTRYAFERRSPGGLARLRVVSRSLRNFVLSDARSFSDAVADARGTVEEEETVRQLDSFQQTFNFCLQCRQYVCPTCWNDADGRCRTCAPMPGDERRPAIQPAPAAEAIVREAIVGEPIAGEEPSVRGEEPSASWPEIDLSARLAAEPVSSETLVTAPGESVAVEESAGQTEATVAGRSPVTTRRVEAEPAPIAVEPESVAEVVPELEPAIAVVPKAPAKLAEVIAEPAELEPEPAAAPGTVAVPPATEVAEPVAEPVAVAEAEPGPAAGEAEPAATTARPALPSVSFDDDLITAATAGFIKSTEPPLAPAAGLAAPPAPPVAVPFEAPPPSAPSAAPVREPDAAVTLAAAATAAPPAPARLPGQPPSADFPSRRPMPAPPPRSAAAPDLARQVFARSGTPAAGHGRVHGPKACVSCGLQLAAASRFCRRCGSRQDAE